MTPLEDAKDDPRNDAAASALPGSGDLGLEMEITRMRGAIIRAVDEIDRFTRSVREARLRVERMVAETEQE